MWNAGEWKRFLCFWNCLRAKYVGFMVGTLRNQTVKRIFFLLSFIKVHIFFTIKKVLENIFKLIWVFFCSCVFYVFVPGFLSRFSLLLFVNSSDYDTRLIGYGMFVYVVGCWYYYLPNCLMKSYVFRSFVRNFIRFHVLIKLCVEIFVAKCRLWL